MLQLLVPRRLDPVLRNTRGHRNEQPGHVKEEWPRSPQLEKSPLSNEDPVHNRKAQLPVWCLYCTSLDNVSTFGPEYATFRFLSIVVGTIFDHF